MPAYPVYHCRACRSRNVPVTILSGHAYCDLCSTIVEATLWSVDMPSAPGDFTLVKPSEPAIIVVECPIEPHWVTPETTN